MATIDRSDLEQASLVHTSMRTCVPVDVVQLPRYWLTERASSRNDSGPGFWCHHGGTVKLK